jgi:hypothetical protein
MGKPLMCMAQKNSSFVEDEVRQKAHLKQSVSVEFIHW